MGGTVGVIRMWQDPNIYLRSVPAGAASVSGLATFRSRLREVGTGRVTEVWSARRGTQAVPPSAYCLLRVDRKPTKVLVPEPLHPRLVDAMTALAEGVTRGERRLRYIRVYHAYESLTTKRTAELVAIRHGLSHAATILSHPTTLAMLQQLFGTAQINLRDRTHRQTFDVHYARLLLEVDALVVGELDAGMSQWTIVAPSVHVRATCAHPRYYSRKPGRRA